MIDLNETFVFTLLNNQNSFMIGTNDTTNESWNYGNGILENVKINGTLTIPDYYQNIPITEIGYFAFTRVQIINHIIIGSNIKIINTYAFGDLPDVKTIYIPSSVEIIYSYGFHFYNATEPGGKSNGHVQIFFESNSNLKYISKCFGQIKSIEVIMPSIANHPICEGYLFNLNEDVVLFSKETFSLCGFQFHGLKTCQQQMYFRSCQYLFLINSIFI